MSDFVEKVLQMFAWHDVTTELDWTSELKFFVSCNDFFAPASADTEEITPDDFDLLNQAFVDAGQYGPELFVCRKRKQSPLPALKVYYEPEIWELFNCG